MRADRVEASWDQGHKKWMVRIQVGEEVVRRYCNAQSNAEESVIRKAAIQTLQDEGYEPDPKELIIRR